MKWTNSSDTVIISMFLFETEKKEAARLAKLTAEQREKELFERQKADFAAQQAAYHHVAENPRRLVVRALRHASLAHAHCPDCRRSERL